MTTPADESNKQSDTGSNAEFQIGRNVIDQLFPETAEGKKHEDDTFDEYCSQSDFPWVGNALLHQRTAYGISEVSVKPHAGCQSHRIVGKESHEQCGDCGGHCRSGKNAGAVHSCRSQHTWVDGQNVDHRKERGSAGDDFRFDVGTVFLEFK